MDDRGHLHELLEDETLQDAQERIGRDLFPVEQDDVQELKEKTPKKRKN